MHSADVGESNGRHNICWWISELASQRDIIKESASGAFDSEVKRCQRSKCDTWQVLGSIVNLHNDDGKSGIILCSAIYSALWSASATRKSHAKLFSEKTIKQSERKYFLSWIKWHLIWFTLGSDSSARQHSKALKNNMNCVAERIINCHEEVSFVIV